MNQSKTFLDETEAVELFKAIDVDGSSTLTADEINVELASINASIILEKIKSNAKESGISPVELFETFDNDKSGTLTVEEFSQLINHCAQEADPQTVDYVVKVIDKEQKGHVSTDDL